MAYNVKYLPSCLKFHLKFSLDLRYRDCPGQVFLVKTGSFVWPLMTLRDVKLPPLFFAYPAF